MLRKVKGIDGLSQFQAARILGVLKQKAREPSPCFMTGSIVMLFTMSLLVAAKRGDEQMEMMMEEKAQFCMSFYQLRFI